MKLVIFISDVVNPAFCIIYLTHIQPHTHKEARPHPTNARTHKYTHTYTYKHTHTHRNFVNEYRYIFRIKSSIKLIAKYYNGSYIYWQIKNRFLIWL